MVEVKDIVIIFKRTIKNNSYIEEYIPIKVVAGYYDEEEQLFIDEEGNTYFHISSKLMIGNCFGMRRNIKSLQELSKNSNISININGLKKRLFVVANQFKYWKNLEKGDTVYQQHKFTKSITEVKESENFISSEDYDIESFFNMDDDFVEESSIATLSQTNKEPEEIKLLPIDIETKLKATVKGQDEAIETIATLLWLMIYYPNKYPKTNMLLVGSTGVGKTLIFQKLKKILDIPVSIYSLAGVSQSGYKGRDLEEMLVQLYYDSGKNISRTQNSIVFIDEFDKIANNQSRGEIGSTAVQQELLKILEGTQCLIKVDTKENSSIMIDTSNIIFVCGGAFQSLYETEKKPMGFAREEPSETPKQPELTSKQLHEFGMELELIGRNPVIIQLNNLTKEILKDIILNSDESSFKNTINVIESMGVTIENLDEIIDLIAEDAIVKEIGARGLLSTVTKIFLKIFREIANNPNKYEKVIVGKNIIEDNSDFKLIIKEAKTKKLTPQR